jgi:Ca-activated chloride channel family protein
MVSSRTSALCVTLAVLGVSAPRILAQAPTFRAGTELVSLGVSVPDGDGGFVEDLAAGDFEVLEDGRPQRVQYFARGFDDGQGPELHVGLLFDTSGSMDGDIALSRTAAIRFLDTLRQARDITLVDFDTEVRVSEFEQHDFPRLVERIRTRRPRGYTAMYDALGVYLDRASHRRGRTILVVFTDGGDTSSALRFDEAITAVRISDVTIYTIGFLQNRSRSAFLDQRVRLDEIASQSGGDAFFPGSMREVEEAYATILAQLRAQYTLGYHPTNDAADGTWREVEVRVRREDVQGERIQARQGYFAPYRPE